MLAVSIKIEGRRRAPVATEAGTTDLSTSAPGGISPAGRCLFRQSLLYQSADLVVFVLMQPMGASRRNLSFLHF